LKAIEPFDVPGNELAMLSKYMINILMDFKRDEEPLRPKAAKLLWERAANPGRGTPSKRCLPGGVPWATFIAPFKMIQASREIVMLHEDNNLPRQIYIDGRKPPTAIDLPSWVGFSAVTGKAILWWLTRLDSTTGLGWMQSGILGRRICT
jgi:hypothetical protein